MSFASYVSFEDAQMVFGDLFCQHAMSSWYRRRGDWEMSSPSSAGELMLNPGVWLRGTGAMTHPLYCHSRLTSMVVAQGRTGRSLTQCIFLTFYISCKWKWAEW